MLYLRIFHSFNFVLLAFRFISLMEFLGNIFNQISTNIWLNLFFAIFLFFALSFLDIMISHYHGIANKIFKSRKNRAV